MVIGLAGMVRVRVRDWEIHYPNESSQKNRNISVRRRSLRRNICVCVCRDGVPLKIVKQSCLSICISSAVVLIVKQLWNLERKFESTEDPERHFPI